MSISEKKINYKVFFESFLEFVEKERYSGAIVEKTKAFAAFKYIAFFSNLLTQYQRFQVKKKLHLNFIKFSF